MGFLFYFLPFIAAIILAFIEAYRIRRNLGIPNIDKRWTYFYMFIAYVFCIILSVGYHDNFSFLKAGVYLLYYAGVRGLIYNPLLNLLRGLKFDYYSKTTNSIIDQLFGSFWRVFFVSLFTWIISFYILANYPL